MATSPVTPAASQSAPSGSPQSIYEQVGAALNGDSGTSHTESPAEVAPPAEAKPVEQPAEQQVASPSGEEPEQQALGDEQVNPYEDGDVDPKEAADTLLKTSRGRTIYQGYKFTRDLAKPRQEGGLGFQPSIQDIVNFHDSHAATAAFENDLSSGDPAAAAQALAHVFDPRRQNSEALIQTLPRALMQQNPRAYLAFADNVVSALPRLMQTQAGAQIYAKAERPILQNYLNAVLNRMDTASSDEMHHALWLTAQMLNKDLTGSYIDPKAPQQGAAQPQADPLAADKQRLQSEWQAINAEKQQTVQRTVAERQEILNGAIGQAIETELEQALAPLKGVVSERQYAREKADLGSKVASALTGDPKTWQLFQIAVQQSIRAGNGIEGVVAHYLRLARPQIAFLRKDVIKEAGGAAVQANQQQHAKMRQIENQKAPSNSGGAAAKPSNGAPAVEAKMPNETHEEYIKRLMGNAFA